MRRIYDFWSHVYDWGLGPPACRRQREAVSRMDIRPGQHVLDIGVGTGLALKAWPAFARVAGIHETAFVTNRLATSAPASA